MRNLTAIIVILIVLAASVYAISVISPKGVDWHIAYYPTARACLNGQTPYVEGGYFENPIWMCALLAPFGLFSEATSRALFLVVSVAGYYAAFHSLGIPRKWIPLILLSPQVLTGLNMGSIDPLILVAPALPPLAGFLLALAKPQIGIGYLLFLTVEWVRQREYRALALALALGGAGLLFSRWLGMPFSGRLIAAPWNTSLFPYSLPLGAILAWLSIRRQDKRLSFIASPLLSPYVAFYSWVVIFMTPKPKYIALALLLSWIGYLIWFFFYSGYPLSTA